MLAEDFRGLIALETLSAGVPARNYTAGIEHVDRVVRDRLDKEAVAAVVAQRCFQALGSLQLGGLSAPKLRYSPA
jgi:hypothetical protein